MIVDMLPALKEHLEQKMNNLSEEFQEKYDAWLQTQNSSMEDELVYRHAELEDTKKCYASILTRLGASNAITVRQDGVGEVP